MKHKLLLILSASFLLLSTNIYAKRAEILNDYLQLNSQGYADTVKLSITGPDGFTIKRELPSFQAEIAIDNVNQRKDGRYSFEFTEIQVMGQKEVMDQFNGRGLVTQNIVVATKTTGTYTIMNGAVVDQSIEEPTRHNLNLNSDHRIK